MPIHAINYIHNRLKIGIGHPLKDQSSTSFNEMTQLEQLVHLKFIKYSGSKLAVNINRHHYVDDQILIFKILLLYLSQK